MSHSASVVVHEWRIPSATGVGELQAKTWAPAGQPRLILQIIHGMAEHMERYDHLARYLAKRGILTLSCDLPGHGRSAPDEKHLGYAAETDGYQKVLEDLHAIKNQVSERMPDVPVVLLGHSMGSFLARLYSSVYGKELAGVIYSGTAGDNPILPVARFLAARSVRRNGAFHRDGFIDKLMHQGYLRKIPNPVSEFDWLSRDPDIVKAYEDDAFCGFVFTAAGYRDLFDLLMAISGRQWAEKVPHNLPIRLISGEDDPVGGYGSGVKQVLAILKKAGHQDVQMILYPGGRHEILNETNREDVYADIANYLQQWMTEGGQG